MTHKFWFITGISSGLGKAIAEAVMQSGDFVIGSFRSQQQAELFNEENKDRAYGLVLDITKPDEIENAFQVISDKFGKLDVLVNNAGFGFAGAIEEASISEVRDVFETNFFGTLQITQKVLPLFRKQRSGHIIQISSHGGFKAFPGFGIYNASKFALEGFSEALATEVSSLGIKLTIVEPGPFRTNFAAESFKKAEIYIDDYSDTAGSFRKRMEQIHGKQEGDPIKAAKAIMDITKMENPPLRLPLGRIAVASLTSKLESVHKDLKDFKEVAENSVYL